MRTIRTKVYKFDELTPEAQDKAICAHIDFEIQVMNEDSPYWYLVEKMEKMQTPWFLGQAIYEEEKEHVAETIRINEYEFLKDGTFYHKKP